MGRDALDLRWVATTRDGHTFTNPKSSALATEDVEVFRVYTEVGLIAELSTPIRTQAVVFDRVMTEYSLIGYDRTRWHCFGFRSPDQSERLIMVEPGSGRVVYKTS